METSAGGRWSQNFAAASVDTMSIYDRVLARNLFDPWARHLISEVAPPEPGSTVLDLACGTGAFTLPLAEAVGPRGRVLAADISEAMIDIARSKQGTGATIDWRVAPAESLPFADASVDGAYSQQGIQFFPDLTVGLKEVKRVLKPGKTFMATYWDVVEASPPWAAINEAFAEVFDREVAPEDLGPWSLARDDAEASTKAAGFTQVRTERISRPIEMSLEDVLSVIWVSPSAQELTEAGPDAINRYATLAAEKLEPMMKDGRVVSEGASWIMFCS
jgi:ubiquinone/menaquinone biosynthesis C-methylase UbiE